MSYSAIPIVNEGLLYINGLVTSVISNTTLGVSLGQCRDSTDVYDINLTSPVVIDAAVNGVNALDTGDLAVSTWYYIYVIFDFTNTNVPAALLSASATAPTIPFGYSAYRLIGYVKTDGSSNFLPCFVSGNNNARTFFWANAVTVLTGGIAGSYIDISIAAAVPTINAVPVVVNVALTPSAAGDAVTVGAPAISATSASGSLSGSVNGVIQLGQLSTIANIVSGVPKIGYDLTGPSPQVNFAISSFQFYV